jgi:hypothetical protein
MRHLSLKLDWKTILSPPAWSDHFGAASPTLLPPGEEREKKAARWW